MKSLMSLWSRLAEESASLCRTSATRDINTVASRVEHEGLSFLTITLPDFGKATQKWLDQGKVGIHPAFVTERGGSLPRFLGGFFSRVFDRRSGQLLDEPCLDSILALRQLTLMFGKIELPCTNARQLKAIQNYIECERDVRLFDSELSDSDILEFTEVSNMLYSSLFSELDLTIQQEDLLPKHGPGGTATGETSNGKYRSLSWTERLNEVFDFEQYLTPFVISNDYGAVELAEPGSEVPVKVTLVPKTMKTPRVIAMEPTCMQYMQQAVYRAFTLCHERDYLLSRLIGFDDQTPNQRLAKRGSLKGDIATLDLSDASDRVSNQLVRAMFSRWPNLNRAIDATRSRRADVPGYGVIRLSKYASMGSALCFPIEAMVFMAIIFVGIQRSLNEPLTRKQIVSLSRSVRVYGDDIIVPVEHVLFVVQALEHFGARVGLDKSFWTGKFRESCGREYFNGTDVSIVRVRRVFPTRRQDAAGVESLVSLRNQLYQSGYWKTVGWLDDYIRKILPYFPNVTPDSPVLGRHCSLGVKSKLVLGRKFERADASLQIPLVKGFYLHGRSPKDNLDGTGALLKCILKLEHGGSLEPTGPYPRATALTGLATVSSEDHLERSGRPKRVDIKLGWMPPV